MQRTGYILLDFLNGMLAFLPTLPVLFILIRRLYNRHMMVYLMLLCLLYSVEALFTNLFTRGSWNFSGIDTIFGLLELLLVIQMFKPLFASHIRQWMNFLSVAFLSVAASFLLLKGASQELKPFEAAQPAIIGLVTFFSLLQIVKKRRLLVLSNHEFWIGTGTLFYYSILFLLNLLPDARSPDFLQNTDDKMLMTAIVGLLRYFFYVLAVFSIWPKTDADMEKTI